MFRNSENSFENEILYVFNSNGKELLYKVIQKIILIHNLIISLIVRYTNNTISNQIMISK